MTLKFNVLTSRTMEPTTDHIKLTALEMDNISQWVLTIHPSIPCRLLVTQNKWLANINQNLC